ncbi:MAG TPA: HD domain-containing phosphohydrolase [Clostridia bacterium]|nr:HD domain-containing phosphohydrolase [Clostridia bacterium]
MIIADTYIDFTSFINSISLSLDLAEACALRDKIKKVDFDVSVPGFNVHKHNFTNHSKKTALVSLYIANKLNYDDIRLKNLYIAACSHDIGAVEAFTESHQDSSFIREHSEFGAQIIKKLPVDSSISEFIGFHHENWDGSGPDRLTGSNIPEESQIIHIADMFELIYDSEKPYWMQREHITAWIRSRQGRYFSPHITDAFMEACKPERFWLDMENISTNPDVLTRMHPPVQAPMSLNTIENIAVVFAAIIDKKSAFTHEHSIGLSHYAQLFSKYYGFDDDTTIKMKIAALLHDIGKLSIPNHILDKPGKLSAEEYTIIKSHTYYTKLILGNISGMQDISGWAASHHETLNGSGYPEGIGAEKLCHQSRIMAVCDIYQALTEARPYRDGMLKEKALGIMDSMVAVGNIDASVVKILKEII